MRTLYRVARVYTLGDPPAGEWLLIDDRHVQRVGTGPPPESDRLVEMPGATILPGFVDTHVHLTSTGLGVANDAVAKAASARALLEIAAARAAGTDGDEPVELQGFDESGWTDPTTPTIAELDAVTARPMVIRRTDGHAALVNTPALERSGALEDADGVARDDAGAPTGLITAGANRAVGAWLAAARSDHAIEELQLVAAGLAATRGVTAVHEMALPLEQGPHDVEVLLAHRRSLPIDVEVVLGSMDVPWAVELGLTAIGGDLALDGSIGAVTAAVSEPYAVGGGRGTLFWEDDVVLGFFRGGHEAGLQVGVHAIGDRAIEQALRAWERLYRGLDSRERRHFRARRHRIEHFEMPSAEQVERAAMLGLAISMQPTFDLTWGGTEGLYERRLGIERAWSMNPVRLLLDRGIELGVGSDAPVVPLDPWRTIHALEQHHDPAQRLQRVEAVRMHTVGSARLAHREEKQGRLVPGMHADFAVYDDDPFAIEDVGGLRPILTVSLGRDVSLA